MKKDVVKRIISSKKNKKRYNLFYNIKKEKFEDKSFLDVMSKINLRTIEKLFENLNESYNGLIYGKNDSIKKMMFSETINTNMKLNRFNNRLNNNQKRINVLKMIDTDKINLKTVALFEEGYKPEWEDDKFVDGGYYNFRFNFKVKNKLDIKDLYMFLYKTLEEFDELKGIRCRLKKENKEDIIDIQMWSIKYDINKKIIEKIEKYYQKIGVKDKLIKYINFYDLPIPENKNISYKDFGNKKIYYLRFDVGIGHFISKSGWWESFMEKYFKKYYKQNTNVIDVGANIGSHTILLGKMLSKDNKVFSFEPIYWDIVIMNAVLNNIQDKVCVFNSGLGKKNEILKIKTYDRSMKKAYGRVSLDGMYDLEEDKDLKIEKKVGIMTLDSIDLRNISLIKIDVEGMELDVLIGARETIKRERPVIFIEILKPKYNEVINSKIMKYVIDECKYNLIKIPEGYANDDYILVPNTFFS